MFCCHPSSSEEGDSSVKTFQLECGCKTVKLSLKDTPDISKYSKQIATYCHCRDCVTFPTICYQAAQENFSANCKAIDVVNHKVDAPHHVFFHDANIDVLQGGEFIQWHKNHTNSMPLRFYATCCGTPLGVRVQFMGTTIVYGRLLNGGETPVPLPMYAAVAGNARTVNGKQEVGVHKDNPDILVYQGFPGIHCILHILKRKLLGIVTDKNNTIPSPYMKHPTNDNEFTIGLDTSVIKVKLPQTA